MKRFLRVASLSLAAAALIFAVACADDDDDIPAAPATPPAEADAEDEEAQVVLFLHEVMDAYNARDVDAFLAAWSSQGLQQEFGVTDAQFRERVDYFMALDRALLDVDNVSVRAGSAFLDAAISIGQGIQRRGYIIDRAGDTWRIEASSSLEPKIRGDTVTIDVEMDESVFDFDAADIETGDIAFHAQNVGEQTHELVLVRLERGVNLLDGLDPDSRALPEGAELIARMEPLEPAEEEDMDGQEGWMVFYRPLEPGLYAMICFQADENDPEGTPHVFKGMIAEFEVTAAGGGN